MQTRRWRRWGTAASRRRSRAVASAPPCRPTFEMRSTGRCSKRRRRARGCGFITSGASANHIAIVDMEFEIDTYPAVSRAGRLVFAPHAAFGPSSEEPPFAESVERPDDTPELLPALTRRPRAGCVGGPAAVAAGRNARGAVSDAASRGGQHTHRVRSHRPHLVSNPFPSLNLSLTSA